MIRLDTGACVEVSVKDGFGCFYRLDAFLGKVAKVPCVTDSRMCLPNGQVNDLANLQTLFDKEIPQDKTCLSVCDFFWSSGTNG